MRKKIIIALCVYSLALLLGGAYIIFKVRSSMADLDRLVTLHRVEILREHYLLQIKRVQTDLTLKDTRHRRTFDAVVKNVVDMGKTIDTCFGCHHNEAATERLKSLKRQTDKYKGALSRVLTISAGSGRLAEEEEAAFLDGEELIDKVRDMIAVTTSNLSENTRKAMSHIERTKNVLFILIAIGPLMGAFVGYVFLSGLTRPVNVLLESARKFKRGDLDHRVEGLKDEFGELAATVNEMADSLKEDMRRIREAKEKLADANQELKLAHEQMVRAETMAALGTLSSGISHELSTPLSVILNMAQLVKQDAGDNPSLLKDLETIEYEANQAIRITRSLLGFAKSAKSKVESVDINEVLEDLFKIIEIKPRARLIRLVKDLDANLSPIHAGAVEMRQVFLNVILNAVQAMPDGGDLLVSSRNISDGQERGISVSIADTGVGIPRENLKSIFRPFFTTKEGGTGLGLAICYGIVQEHNGRIDVESEGGKGTTFTIYLPADGKKGGACREAS